MAFKWRSYVEKREHTLAAETDPYKIAGPPAVGFDWLLPDANPDDLPGLLTYVRSSMENLDQYYAVPTLDTVVRTGNILSFASAVTREQTNNNRVHAQVFLTNYSDRAV